MRSTRAVACAACFGLALAPALFQQPLYAALPASGKTIEACNVTGSASGFGLTEADGGMSDPTQSTPGGQAGNPSISPPTATMPLSLPKPAAAPRAPYPEKRPTRSLTGQIRREDQGENAAGPGTTEAATASLSARVLVQLVTPLSSANSHVDDNWRGTLASSVILNGKTIARAGDQVTGKVTFARSQGGSDIPGQLTLRVTAVNGHPVLSSAFRAKAAGPRDGDAPRRRTLIGALAGGGKEAAIGAAASTGTGTTPAPQTKGEVVLLPESVVVFTVTEKATAIKQ